MPLRTAAGLAVASVVAVLSGCGDTGTSPDAAVPPPTPASSAPEQSPAAPSSGPSAGSPTVPATLAFTGTTVEGKDFDGASLAGRPVVLWFWAPWCAVCRSQIPLVEHLAETYGGQASVVGIGSLDGAEAIAAFADDTTGVIQLTDPDGALWRRFEITEQSSFVVLDAEGRETHRSGYASDDGVEAAVDDAVEAGPPAGS